jgi:hypothetical protein
MATSENPPISADAMAELKEAARRAAQGIRDPEMMRRACQHMDQVRDEIRQRHGVQDIGVEIIRDMRRAR